MKAITVLRQALNNAKTVGHDQYGNVYYEHPQKNKKTKRWVIYRGLAEGSRVPPEWHGWLHHMFEAPPTETYGAPYSWQTTHKPNLSGTKNAYAPQPRNINNQKPYTPWHPNN